MKYLALVAVYLAGWILTWGALMADLNNIGDVDFANKRYRERMSLTCGLALIPITWVISPFLTGFYEHGWRLSRRTEERK